MAILALTGCNKEEFINKLDNYSITATFENASESKVAIGTDNSLTWTTGDAFAILTKQGAAHVFTLQGQGGSSTGTFIGSSSVDGDIHGATFPFSSANPPVVSESNLVFNMPSEIEYSAGICNSPMWADGSYGITSLSFKHMVSLLKVQFNNIPATSGQLIITASNPLSGEFTADLTNNGEKFLVASNDNTSNKVVVKFEVGSITSALFLIPIPVGTYESFAISYANPDGTNETCVKYWSNLTFTRAIPNATTVTIGNIDATLNTDYSISSDESTYTINTPAGLFWFANEVNTGNNYFNGKTVILANDIDLNNIPWKPIGSKKPSVNMFKGTFDGNNKTIKNLRITGEEYVGLFGYIEHDATTIKNLNITNANIEGSHFVGTIAGMGVGAKFDHCTVDGGKILVKPILVDGTYDNGDKVGGITGYTGGNNGTTATPNYSTVKNCAIKNVNITAYRDFGGLIGYAQEGKIEYSNNSIENCILTVDQNYDPYKDAPVTDNAGIHIGRCKGNVSVDNTNTSTNTIITKLISTVTQLKAFAQSVNSGNTYIGWTINLGANINLNNDEWTPIGNTKDHEKSFRGTFDGNGYTISNFTITKDEAAGFFGYKYGNSNGNSDIKNVTFDNVTVTGNHYGGVIVGWADGANRGRYAITNCHVKNSSVTLSVKNNDNGDKAGAIAGYFYACDMTNCSVESTTIKGYRDLGGLVGIANCSSNKGATVTNNEIKTGVTIVLDNSNNYENYTTRDNYNINHYAGRVGTISVVKDNTGSASIDYGTVSE